MKTPIPSLLLAAAAGVAGCAAPTLTYQEPAQGERARVRFATNTSDVMVLRAYDDAACSSNENEWMRLREGSLASPAPKRLGMPLWDHHENAAKEVWVDAARARTFLFIGSVTYSGTAHRCGVPMTFQFEAGKDYEVAYTQMLQTCIVNVSTLRDETGAPKKTRLATFHNRVSPATAGCLAQFEKGRWK